MFGPGLVRRDEMNCGEVTNLMEGYLDGELDPITNQRIERHLRDCPACEQAYQAHSALIRAIETATPYYRTPVELRQRIQSSLREEIAGHPAAGVLQEASPSK